MVGLVLVCHSAKLAESVAELAAQVGGGSLRIGVAGGLDQPGDPLGTFLQCAAGHEFVAKALIEEFRDVITVIFADDYSSWLPLARLEEFIQRMQQLLGTMGQTLNMAKCKALLVGGNAADRDRFNEAVQRLGITPADGGICVVGLPVSEGKAYLKNWADKLADKVIAQQERLADTLNEPANVSVPRFQALLTALRLTGPASFNWAARGLHPSITKAAAGRVDAALRRILLSRFNLLARYNQLDADEQAYANARIGATKTTGGIALGGCALAQDGGFLGGLASLARSLRAAYPTFRLSQLRDDADPVLQKIRDLDPTSKLAVNSKDIDELANGLRSGKVVQFNVTAIQHGDAHERLKRDWGVSNRTANLVASQGSALAAIDAWCRWIESRLTDAEMRTLAPCSPARQTPTAASTSASRPTASSTTSTA